MAAHITRLRIAGFKSFADPVSIDVLPGLTGVVGPNGCGKSNVVEALRWAMGESSARSLRGGEMDDLIFAGTGARAARNLAEVTLHLEDAAGIGPAPFQAEPELQVSRRAERGSGSDYRINGRTMRARDVQTLFADLSSGARSSAMVSQNRVGQLIGAKPEERRAILEEAAGITGLHVRRHDAELKLRQTEANLARADDLRLQLEQRIGALSEQSEQAGRYRTIAAALREAEIALHVLIHARAAHQARTTVAALQTARRELELAENRAETATITEHEASQAIAPARETAEDGRTRLERLRVQSETARAAMERAERDAQDARSRREQGERDHDAAAQRLQDADSALERLLADLASATVREAAMPEDLTHTRADLSVAVEQARSADTAVEAALESLRQAQTAMTTHEERRRTATDYQQQLETQLAALDSELARLMQDTPDEDVLARIVTDLEAATDATQAAEQMRLHAEEVLNEARLSAQMTDHAAREAQARADDLNDQDRRLRERIARQESQRAELAASLAQARGALVKDSERARLGQIFTQASDALNAARQTEDDAGTAQTDATRLRLEAASGLRDAGQRHALAENVLKSAQATLDRAKEQGARVAEAWQSARQRVPDPQVLDNLTQRRNTAEAALAQLLEQIEVQDTALPALRTAFAAAEAAVQSHRNDTQRLSSQRAGLAETLASYGNDAQETLLDVLDIPEPLIPALACLLSDGLDAALPGGESSSAPRLWNALPGLPPTAWPSGVTPLTTRLAPPPALRRCFEAVGIVETARNGEACQPDLHPGQILVTLAGDLWRWDGFQVRAGSPNAVALRLTQRHQMARCDSELDALVMQAEDIQTRFDSAANAMTQAQDGLDRLRSQRSRHEQEASVARRNEADARLAAEEAAVRLAAVETQHAQASHVVQEAEAAHQAAHAEWRTLPELAALKRALTESEARQSAALEAANTARQTRLSAQERLEKARIAQDQALARHRAATLRLETQEPAHQRIGQDLASAKDEMHAIEAARQVMDDPQQAKEADHLARRAVVAAESVRAETRRMEETARERQTALARTHRDTYERAVASRSRIESLQPGRQDLHDTLEIARADLATLLSTRDALADPDAVRQTLDQARADLARVREQETGLRAREAALVVEQAQITQFLSGLRAQQQDTQARRERAALDHAEQAVRLTALREADVAAAEGPPALAHAHATQIEALSNVEARWRELDEASRTAQQALTEAQAGRRDADLALAQARTDLATIMERAAQAEAALEKLRQDDQPPGDGPIPQDLSDQAETSLKRKIGRLTRERDDLGPVNLRADIEFEESRTQADTIERECGELVAAIERLRGSIGSLNKEGRERLNTVFVAVDTHFQTLFSRMFGGGRAHLALIGSDDPLEAGLEIYAQPPGKKLSALSLLSGGEQALTALSLIFATHLCNPAPICVLDEVDAPLDDANVERFCTLLADMAANCGTRFLVVTHHQVTMAHMDRLYGVTMQERGVSRVLSVDLSLAASMISVA